MRSKLFASVMGIFLILCSVILASGQSPCEWKRITRISNKILNNPKVKRGIWEQNDGKTQSLNFGTDTALKDVVFADDKNGWIAGGKDVFLKTTNGGLSWTTKSVTSDETNGVFFLDKQNGWAVGRNKLKAALYETKNSGTTWRLRQPIQKYERSNFSQIRFANGRTGWMIGFVERPGSNPVVFKTTDSGANWEIQYSEDFQEDGSTNFSDLEVIDENNVIVIGDRSLIRTSDGGKNWKKLYKDGSFNFSDIEFVSEKEGWVVGLESNILHTVDGGENWSKQSIKAVDTKWEIAYTAVKFINSQEGWVAGWVRDLEKEDSPTDSFILKTKDGGKNWQIEKRGKDLIFNRMTATSRAVFAVGADGLIMRRLIGCR